MGYETKTCAGCGHREPMDLSTEIRFAGEFGPLCDDCRPLALRTMEANTKDNADPAPDPALLALAQLGAMVLDWSPLECGFPTMPGSVIDAMAVRAGVALEDSGDGGHACWTAPGVKLAIARLLAPDGVDGAVEVGP